MTTLLVFYSSVSSSTAIKKHQTKLQQILESKKIAFVLVDVAALPEARDRLKQVTEAANIPLPYLARVQGNVSDVSTLDWANVSLQKIGDFEAFEYAVEDGVLESFVQG